MKIFCKNLSHVIAKEKFGQDSIWNTDETGITTMEKYSCVIASNKLKQVGHVTSSESGQTVTVYNAINAIGNSIPPFFIFPYVKSDPAFLFGASPDFNVTTHVLEWMSKENSVLYLKHFAKYSKCSEEKKKFLLILDNHDIYT